MKLLPLFLNGKKRSLQVINTLNAVNVELIEQERNVKLKHVQTMRCKNIDSTRENSKIYPNLEVKAKTTIVNN